MSYEYTDTNGKAIKFESKINLCKKNGVISICTAKTQKDQHGCKFRMSSSVGSNCMHFRESLDGACDSLLAQIGKEPYECKDCEKFKTCGLKNSGRECTLEEKIEKMGRK